MGSSLKIEVSFNLLKWAIPGISYIHFQSFQTTQFTQQIHVKNDSSSYYLVRGFELTTS